MTVDILCTVFGRCPPIIAYRTPAIIDCLLSNQDSGPE